MTPEERRAYQNARNARKRAARTTAPGSDILTYLGNPADNVYTVHRVSCHVLRGRGSNIGGLVHWRAKRYLCKECRPDPAAADELPVRRGEPPETIRDVAAIRYFGEATARRLTERRVQSVWREHWEGVLYAEFMFPPSPSAEDEYLADLEYNAELDSWYDVSCGGCNRPQTVREWNTGTCVGCDAPLNWPRRTEHPALTLDELACA